jgi:hypothetical protein
VADNTGKKPPLKDPKVEVRAEPDWDSGEDPDWDYIDKVQEGVDKEVSEAVEEAEPDGAAAQVGAATEKVEEASKKVNPKKVDRLTVHIDDKDGRHTEIVRKATGEG